jgi:membrane-associated protein
LPDRFFYKRKYLTKTEEFYQKYGSWAVAIGRFMPILRTFSPLLAGIVRMPWFRFTCMNVLGGLVWGMGVVLVGYGLATASPALLNHMNWLLIGIVVLSILPAIVALLRSMKKCLIGSTRIK